MAEVSNRWVEAVIQLLKLTQEGKLHWDLRPVGNQPLFEENQGFPSSAIFTTTYNEKTLQLYEERYKRPKRRGTFMDYWGAVPLSDDSMVWDTRVILEFVSEKGARLWAFPDMAPLEDLLTSVQYQVAGVKDFLDDLLSEDKSGKAAIGLAEADPTK